MYRDARQRDAHPAGNTHAKQTNMCSSTSDSAMAPFLQSQTTQSIYHGYLDTRQHNGYLGAKPHDLINTIRVSTPDSAISTLVYSHTPYKKSEYSSGSAELAKREQFLTRGPFWATVTHHRQSDRQRHVLDASRNVSVS